VLESKRASGSSEFALRAPEWWRDLTLGSLFGVALVWAFADALHWDSFRGHIAGEIVFVGIPSALASLSPRRILALFIGLSVVLFRCIFLIFLFQNLWSTLATLAWFLLLVLLGRAVNRRYRLSEMRIPEGYTIVEFLLLAIGLGGGLCLLYLLRRLLGLG
jgi:hypothetical protein